MNTNTPAAVLLLRLSLDSLPALRESLRAAELSEAQALAAADALARLAARERLVSLLVFASALGVALSEGEEPALLYARARGAAALAEFSEALASRVSA